MSSTLAYIWYVLFLIPVVLFVILDGADLGTGIISLAAPRTSPCQIDRFDWAIVVRQ